jgi:arsenate reductase
VVKGKEKRTAKFEHFETEPPTESMPPFAKFGIFAYSTKPFLGAKPFMTTKVYYLSSCSTCDRILKDLDLSPDKADLQDIKTNKITHVQLDLMKELAGSYDALFSRVALKYRALGLDKKALTETDYRKYILEEYTFLKRPVIIHKGRIFIGNTKKMVEAAREALS